MIVLCYELVAEVAMVHEMKVIDRLNKHLLSSIKYCHQALSPVSL
jgi:hypothetical protein